MTDGISIRPTQYKKVMAYFKSDLEKRYGHPFTSEQIHLIEGIGAYIDEMSMIRILSWPICALSDIHYLRSHCAKNAEILFRFVLKDQSEYFVFITNQ